MTTRTFKADAERIFRKANPDAKGLTINWTRCNRVTWANGSKGHSGDFIAAAEGFRPRSVLATQTPSGTRVK